MISYNKNNESSEVTTSSSSTTMIKLTTALLAASSLLPCCSVVALSAVTTTTSRGSYHAGVQFGCGYPTISTDSSRGAKSWQPRSSAHLGKKALFYRQEQQPHGKDDPDNNSNDHMMRDTSSSTRLYSLPFSRWWSSICRGGGTNSDPNDDESTKQVDDYLEFLDRRYHRLHNTPAANTKGNTFSALNWLMEKPSVTDDEKSDALYVLGLASLASDRFLEKHHIPREFKTMSSAPPTTTAAAAQTAAAAPASSSSSPSSSRVVVEAEVVEPLSIRSSPIVSLPAEFLRKIGASRQELIAIQTKQLQVAVSLLLKTMVSLPGNAVRMFWTFGGGKKTLTLTCWALVTAVVIIRPVVQSLVIINNKTMQG